MTLSRLIISLSLLVLLAIVSVAQQPEISIIHVESDECTLLERLSDDYADAIVTVRCVPQSQWFDAIFIDLAARSGADILMLDTQFLGTAAGNNHLLPLDDWYTSNITSDIFPASVMDIHRTDGTLFAMPAQPDASLLAYRADIYQEAGLDVPSTYADLVAHARIFEASDLIAAGFATHWSRQEDYVSGTWNHILWSYGGTLWDEPARTVTDIINNEIALDAITIATALYQTAPDNALTFTPEDVAVAICRGDVSIVELPASFARQLVNPATCEQAQQIAFTTLPEGDAGRFSGYGGTAMSISAYTPQPEAALEFMRWFFTPDIQQEWVRNGGLTARIDILADDSIRGTLPFLSSYSETLNFVRDYWQIPEYSILLGIQQQYLQFAISGQLDPQAALDALANAQQDVLDYYNTDDD